jgi:hypothetical protein
MNSAWQAAELRMLDLLADRATFGLAGDEEDELKCLTRLMPDFDRTCMEKAVATVQLACASIEPLPGAVRARLSRRAKRHVANYSRGSDHPNRPGCHEEQDE